MKPLPPRRKPQVPTRPHSAAVRASAPPTDPATRRAFYFLMGTLAAALLYFLLLPFLL